MPTTIHAYAATEPGGKIEPFEYELGDLKPDEVEIDVRYCGVCHSDLSMLQNDWGLTTYPFVPGHEVVGTISAVGDTVTHLKTGQTVGLGWYSRSCMTCDQCMSGHHNLCPNAVGTIVGRHGGFADKVRAQAAWVTPLPDALDGSKAGPLFCGGITVFGPIIENQVSPTARVGVVGIGGLGHMALKFLHAWGCEVTAFSSSPDKAEEARKLGAHQVINSRDPEAIKAAANSLDMVLVTVNVGLDWEAYISTLRPKGRLHFVGAAPSVSASVFSLLETQKTIGASPLSTPVNTHKMVEFATRHGILPITEHYKLSEVNDAMEHLKAGKARYRIVLEV